MTLRKLTCDVPSTTTCGQPPMEMPWDWWPFQLLAALAVVALLTALWASRDRRGVSDSRQEPTVPGSTSDMATRGGTS